MKVLALLLLVASAALAASPFRFRDVSPASVELTENGRPVYVYNHGMMRPEGVPADRYRCCGGISSLFLTIFVFTGVPFSSGISVLRHSQVDRRKYR